MTEHHVDGSLDDQLFACLVYAAPESLSSRELAEMVACQRREVEPVLERMCERGEIKLVRARPTMIWAAREDGEQ